MFKKIINGKREIERSWFQSARLDFTFNFMEVSFVASNKDNNKNLGMKICLSIVLLYIYPGTNFVKEHPLRADLGEV